MSANGCPNRSSCPKVTLLAELVLLYPAGRVSQTNRATMFTPQGIQSANGTLRVCLHDNGRKSKFVICVLKKFHVDTVSVPVWICCIMHASPVDGNVTKKHYVSARITMFNENCRSVVVKIVVAKMH